MMRTTFFIVIAVLASACGGDSPVGPSPSDSTPAVRSVAISTVSTDGATFQMRATATRANGATSDVTANAQWQSSNVQLASVSSNGLLTVLGTGEVDVRATYEGVSGSLRLLVNKAVPDTNYALTGRVLEAGANGRPIEGAVVRLTAGPNIGRTSVTDARGVYGFPMLSPGRISLEITKDGYRTWSAADIDLSPNTTRDAELVPVSEGGGPATAR